MAGKLITSPSTWPTAIITGALVYCAWDSLITKYTNMEIKSRENQVTSSNLIAEIQALASIRVAEILAEANGRDMKTQADARTRITNNPAEFNRMWSIMARGVFKDTENTKPKVLEEVLKRGPVEFFTSMREHQEHTKNTSEADSDCQVNNEDD